MLCLFLPILVILLNTEKVLVAIKQDAVVSAYSQQYTLVYLPGLLVQGLADCQRKFLNNFGKNKIPLYASLIGFVIHTLSCYTLVIVNKWDIVGLGFANVISSVSVYAVLLIYTNTQEDIKEALVPPSLHEATNNIKVYLGLAIPSTIMLVLDWWIWEFMVLISGYLGVNE